MGGGRRSWEGPETPFSHWYWDPKLEDVERARGSLLKGLWLEATFCLTVLLGTTGYSLLQKRRQKILSISVLVQILPLTEPQVKKNHQKGHRLRNRRPWRRKVTQLRRVPHMPWICIRALTFHALYVGRAGLGRVLDTERQGNSPVRSPPSLLIAFGGTST